MFEDNNEESLDGANNYDIADAQTAESKETEHVETDEDQSDKSISADLIRGHINTIILRALYDGDKYGYEIITEIEKKSHGQYTLKQPSLYSALKRLEREGYVTSYWGGSVAGGRRKYFSLTDDGKNISERNQSEWEYSRTVIDSLISDKQFDFANSTIPLAVDMRVLKQSTSRVPNREGEEDEEDEEKKVLDEELVAERAALEETKTRYEEEYRAREQELLAREEAVKTAEEEVQRAAQEAQQAQQAIKEQTATVNEEERQRVAALSEELEKQNSQIAEMQSLISQHTEYEQQLQAQAEAEKAKHARELAEQEARIRQESEILYQQREREMIHQNYLNLVNHTPEPTPTETAYYNAPAEQEPREETPYYEYSEKESGYRSIIQRLYSNSVQDTEPAEPERPPIEPILPQTEEAEQAKPIEAPRASAPTQAPATAPAKKDTRSLSGIDFYDLETLAAQDGIKITTAGGGNVQSKEEDSSLLVNKGKALFLSALVVFLLCLAEGSIALGFQSVLSLPRFYPYFIWGTGLALLFVMGLALINRYGERTIRRSGNILINTVVAYALCVIAVLIVALCAQIDFTNRSQLCTFVIFPLVYLFGVIAFGIAYYAQVHPYKE